MTEMEQGIPTRWTELIPRVTSSLDRALQTMKKRAAAFEDEEPIDTILQLASPAETIAEMAVGAGPAAVQPMLALFEPFLRPSIDALAAAGVDVRTVAEARALLSYANVALCCGAALPAPYHELEARWLRAVADDVGELSNERERQLLGFAALGAGQDDLVPTFFGGGPLADRVAPGAEFALNLAEPARYLAAAARAGLGAADVDPAWMDLVRNFPRKLGARSIGWVALLCVARARYARFDRLPVGKVAQAVHELVTA